MARKRTRTFHGTIGLKLDKKALASGRARVTGKVGQDYLNVNGVVHGGVYATILDTAMGWAIITILQKSEIMATTSLYLEFLRPAKVGQTLIATGSVVRRGRHMAFCEGKLTDGKGILLSTAKGTWYIRKRPA